MNSFTIQTVFVLEVWGHKPKLLGTLVPCVLQKTCASGGSYGNGKRSIISAFAGNQGRNRPQ